MLNGWSFPLLKHAFNCPFWVKGLKHWHRKQIDLCPSCDNPELDVLLLHLLECDCCREWGNYVHCLNLKCSVQVKSFTKNFIRKQVPLKNEKETKRLFGLPQRDTKVWCNLSKSTKLTHIPNTRGSLHDSFIIAFLTCQTQHFTVVTSPVLKTSIRCSRNLCWLW